MSMQETRQWLLLELIAITRASRHRPRGIVGDDGGPPHDEWHVGRHLVRQGNDHLNEVDRTLKDKRAAVVGVLEINGSFYNKSFFIIEKIKKYRKCPALIKLEDTRKKFLLPGTDT